MKINKENIEKKIKSIISKQFNINIEDINGDKPIKKEFNADSLDIIELVMTIEEKFNIEISDDDIEKLETVNEIVKYLEEKDFDNK